MHAQIDQADTDKKLRDIFVINDDSEELSTLVTDTGYQVALTRLKVTDKESRCKLLREYYTLIKVLPEINQFGEGLETLGVLTMMRKYPDLFLPYLTNTGKKPINNFLDFVDECEGMLYFNFVSFDMFMCIDQEVQTPDGNITVTPEHILAFFTGADCIPPLRFSKTATLMFTLGLFATSSTCSLVMYLPYCHEEFTTFKSFMIESLISNGGFGLV